MKARRHSESLYQLSPQGTVPGAQSSMPLGRQAYGKDIPACTRADCLLHLQEHSGGCRSWSSGVTISCFCRNFCTLNSVNKVKTSRTVRWLGDQQARNGVGSHDWPPSPSQTEWLHPDSPWETLDPGPRNIWEINYWYQPKWCQGASHHLRVQTIASQSLQMFPGSAQVTCLHMDSDNVVWHPHSSCGPSNGVAVDHMWRADRKWRVRVLV